MDSVLNLGGLVVRLDAAVLVFEKFFSSFALLDSVAEHTRRRLREKLHFKYF